MKRKNQFETLLEMSVVLKGSLHYECVSISKDGNKTMKAVTSVSNAKRAATV